MALVNMNEMLQKAKNGKYAVANFDVFNVEMLCGVLNAAQQKNSPVILAYAEVFEPLMKLELFAKMAIACAKDASVPVCLHLDHARGIEFIKKAVDNGFTSVMIDASDKSFAQNVAATKEVVALCAPKNISVESELGHVGGLEGYETGYGDELTYTQVAEAAEFIKQTGIDALAVSIGTVHGVYKSEPKLNLQRLQELCAALSVPLVMHGGSGLSEDDFRNAVKFGITKTNIFTDLTIAAQNCINHDLLYFDQCMAIEQAVCDEAIKKLELFSSVGKA
ncbi:MAG: class II fructose-bisphosphate aldolase [Christensenellaceae bacterium]